MTRGTKPAASKSSMTRASITLALILTLSGAAAGQDRAAADSASPPSGPKITAGEVCFREGRALYVRGRYDDAIKTFRHFLKQDHHSELSDLILLWQGRAQYKSGRNNDSVKTARKLRQMGSADLAELLELEILRAAGR